MVLSAINAVSYTQNTIQVQEDRKLQQEVTRAEKAILNAANLQRYRVAYDARIIGNPDQDPHDGGLTQTQQDFFDAFVDAGYGVSRSDESGLWVLSWEDTGPESVVTIYSVRTSVTPGALITDTQEAIQNYLKDLTPRVNSRVLFTNDIDETEFDATTSEVYEFTVIADQPNDDDHSSGIETAIQVLAPYTSDNVRVYKLG